MSKILEMRQKRAEVWDKARAFLDERTNENGVMTAEDSQQYERMEQEVVDLGHTIDRIPDMTTYKAMRMAFDSLLYPYRDPEKMF